MYRGISGVSDRKVEEVFGDISSEVWTGELMFAWLSYLLRSINTIQAI